MKIRSVFVLGMLCIWFFSGQISAAPAPKFSLPGLKGEISLSDFSGQVVYVDFWASWCGPCRKSFPWMNEMVSKYEKLGFKIIAINLDKERKLANEFLANVPHKFLIGFDPEGATAYKYEVRGMPSSYLIDRNGEIKFSHMGFRQEKTAEVESQIKSLIK